MQIGNTYNIYNGFAETIESLWINNVELIGITKLANGTHELEFQKEDGDFITIDADLMKPWNYKNKGSRVYMFMEKNS
jgi:calcineurin-like phosphoesterase